MKCIIMIIYPGANFRKMILFLNLLKIAFLLSFLLTPTEIAFCQSQSGVIILDGLHKFSAGDKSGWANIEFDDSKWKTIKIPGSWQSQKVKSDKGMGWYRIHLNITDQFKNIEPAILLGRIGDIDEVYFNGKKIGSHGIIGNRYVEASKIHRLYKIPGNLIKFNSDNIICIRVMNTYLNGGLFDENIAFGDYNILLIEKMKREKFTFALEYSLFTFFLMFFIGCLFFYLKGLREREYLFFWLFVTLYGIIFTLNSVTFYNLGIKNSLVQQIISAISLLLPANLLMVLKNVFKEKLTNFIKSLLLIFVLLSLTIFFFPYYEIRQIVYLIWKICFAITAVILFYFALKAFKRHYYESGSTLLGIAGLIAGFILESIAGVDFLQSTGFFLWDYSTAFFMTCVMYALAARFTRIKELQTISIRIFKAHEEERKRLAREIHDSIGPSLTAIKMQIQMVAKKIKEGIFPEQETVNELIHEITHSIEDMRTIAMDLRPSFLETTDIKDAILWHAKKLQERFGIVINLNIEDITNINIDIKEALYRIYQEAITNIIKHADATMVDIILKRDGKFISMEIRDNGKGFEFPNYKDRTKGLGLDTIKERVELLEGIISIKSNKNVGTTINIRVPLK